MKLLNKLRIITALALITALLVPSAVIAEENEFTFEQMAEIFEKLSDYHVSGASESELSEAAAEAMLKVLEDPYTEYFTDEEWEAYKSSLEQNFVGIGVHLNEDEKGIFIEKVIENSPAEAAGLQAGDYFAEVEGESMEGVEINELVTKVKGPENTPVNITILRDQDLIDFELIRQQVQIPVIESDLYDGGIGYIQLTSFTDKAGELFEEELEMLQEQELNGLIIDLRNNPGGYLHAALEIAEQFIEDGALMYTRDKDGDTEAIEIEDGDSLSIPVVVLVNGRSASASEVLSGALQDYEIATIIGEQTFGKGSVQNLLPLSEGGVLKVTTYEYLTPDKHKVNEIGITPDIEVEQNSTAQLITALYEVGIKDLEITIEDQNTEVNGVSLNTSIDVVEQDEEIYVPSRILSAIIQAEIAWNAEERAVEMMTETTSAIFPVNSDGLLSIEGTTYIELTKFEEQFPLFDWEIQEGIITLDIN
ncbi:S41 family peptidase [Chengkuizengella axinellae]|uniref:S41 family peptidase n=1 Tax=Chengkuizengella axinellae TaxID=3064388 RepID=A0ABT9IX79_9BACL|nr:S41 family peptidase [Chengkuizengella sp. 2205SS18-9]MDP5273968.1 S41 family peptidase [Chengkuizengella sp. 2205SS18-9]